MARADQRRFGAYARPLSAILLLVAASLTGCVLPADSPGEAPRETRPGVVVAVIDRGWNPYHEMFRREAWTHHPSEVVPLIPNDLPSLNLTLGSDYEASLEADRAAWRRVAPGTVYWVPGTNLLYLAHRVPTDYTHGAGPAGGRHGVPAAAAASQACPECYVFVVWDSKSGDGESIAKIADEMPWVDFVAMTSIPTDITDPPTIARATRKLTERGGLFFGASGNEPVFGSVEVLYRGYSLPPWVVMVGGAHSECGAVELKAGKPTEFVGNFSQVLAEPGSVSEYSVASGTSFSTPQVAGMFGLALLDVRRNRGYGRTDGVLHVGDEIRDSSALRDGVLTGEELRSAVSRAARYFAPTDYSCVRLASSGGTPIPASPTPWVEMGWGYVGREEAGAAAQWVLGRAVLGEKPESARAYMEQFQAARSAVYP